MKFQKFWKSIFSIFMGTRQTILFFLIYLKRRTNSWNFWGFKRQKWIKTRFFSSLLIFTIFGQKIPKNQNKLFFSTKKQIFESMHRSQILYTAQNIHSELLSKVLGKNSKKIKILGSKVLTTTGTLMTLFYTSFSWVKKKHI